MTRNQVVFTELMKAVDEIKIRLKKFQIYEKEFIQLAQSIKRSLKISHHSSYFEKNEVVKCIMKIIHVITREIERLEMEIRGVGNYSSYESQCMNAMILKQSAKDDLNTILRLIIQTRHEIRDSVSSHACF